LRPLQAFERFRQALRHHRQLAPHQALQLRPIAVVLARRDGAEHVQGLQQVLDVVGGARAGFVHRLQVARLPQLRLAQLGDVELGEQLSQQVQVPLQRRADAEARVDGQRDLLVGKLDRVGRALAALAALLCRPR
jgi:hypothetical protein